MPKFAVRERLASLPTQRAENIGLALLVLGHMIGQGMTVSDAEKHLWVLLFIKLVRETVASD